MNMGEKIREARLNKGMTQEELGQLIGVQKSAIAKYENGRVVNIKRSTLKKISEILDLRPTELIFEEKEKSADIDGLTEEHRALIDVARTLSEEEAARMLQMLQLFLNRKQ